MTLLVSFELETPLGVFRGRGRIEDPDDYENEAAKPRYEQCRALRVDDVQWDSTGPVIEYARAAWWWTEDYTYLYPHDVLEAAYVPTGDQPALFPGSPRSVADTTGDEHDPGLCTPNAQVQSLILGLARTVSAQRGEPVGLGLPS